MKSRNYIEKMTKIQERILNFLDDEDDTEENSQNLIKLFDDYKIRVNRYDLKSILYLLASITNNHNRSSNFFHKISPILKNLQNEITKYFTNYEIFNIFSSNKRILLTLIELGIITIDKHIFEVISDNGYSQFLFPEIKSFLTEKEIQSISKDIQENFEEKRKNGENDEPICELIRKDNIDEFITFVNKNSVSLNTRISNSIFETNLYLTIKQPSLIEYAAFFGSIQIFKYLYLNHAKANPDLWIYAIHGRNPEMINFLIEKKIKPANSNYQFCIDTAIECHHNDIYNYIKNNLLNEDDNVSSLKCIEYYNFALFNEVEMDDSAILKLCQYDYFNYLGIVLEETNFKINKRIVLNGIFKSNFIYFLFK